MISFQNSLKQVKLILNLQTPLTPVLMNQYSYVLVNIFIKCVSIYINIVNIYINCVNIYILMMLVLILMM